MMTLGIESTAHTLSIGITRDGAVLSNVIDMYMSGNEGFIPRKLADHHAAVFQDVLSRSLEKANVSVQDLDLVAFAQGPGIGAPLSVGVAAAKYLALRQGKPLIGVNHCYAHLKISEHMCRMPFPLVLYLSGATASS